MVDWARLTRGDTSIRPLIAAELSAKAGLLVAVLSQDWRTTSFCRAGRLGALVGASGAVRGLGLRAARIRLAAPAMGAERVRAVSPRAGWWRAGASLGGLGGVGSLAGLPRPGRLQAPWWAAVVWGALKQPLGLRQPGSRSSRAVWRAARARG